MLDNIKWLGHATIKILGDKIIYTDPFNIKKDYNDADIIFITHNHYDHYSPLDIKKCMKKDTLFVVTEDLYDEVSKLTDEKNIISVLPENTYKIDNISFDTVPAYNIDKSFHPKENKWVGYIINIDNIKYYIAGDTDVTYEAKEVKCDVAFLPVGGKFTTNSEEAAMLANIIKPKVTLPIHFGSIIGDMDDAINFKANIDESIKCEILEVN